MKIITYNYYCRPRGQFMDSQLERCRLFPKALMDYEDKNGPVDVIMFQELFDNKSYKIMKKGLKKLGFAYKVGRTDNWLYLNGGGAIFSRHPFADTGKLNFKKAHVFNKVTLKGMNYACIESADKKYHICNTHLDSFEPKFRKQQMKKILEFIRCKEGKGDVVVVGGDMNVNLFGDEISNVRDVFDEYVIPDPMETEDESKKFASYVGNDYIMRRPVEKEHSEWLDFFVCKGATKLSSMEVLHFRQPHKAFDIVTGTKFYLNCYDPTQLIKEELKMNDLSDHFAVMIDIL